MGGPKSRAGRPHTTTIVMPATPLPCYTCNVCGAKGEHWRVNCPTIQSEGRQNLHGVHRAKKFGRGEPRTVHLGGGPPVDKSAVDNDPATRSWSFDELDDLPMRASCLQQNVLVAALPPEQQLRVWAFVRRRCMPQNPEVARALAVCAKACPTALRVKELIESVEAYAVAETFISGCAARGRPTTTIADVACGHGMVGLLLAYRFPHSKVVCCDLARRPAFDAMVDAFAREARKLEAWAAPLQNLSFVEGTLDCEAIVRTLGPEACVVALHACTEANFAAVEMALRHGAKWVLMPCCMRTDACAPAGCQLRRCADDTRHALLCGSLAARYACELLVQVDRRITNRNIVLCGGSGAGGGEPVRFLLPPSSTTAAPHRYPDHYGSGDSQTIIGCGKPEVASDAGGVVCTVCS